MHGQKGDDLPLGPARLQWSFNHDGEAAAGMVEARQANGPGYGCSPEGPPGPRVPGDTAGRRRRDGRSISDGVRPRDVRWQSPGMGRQRPAPTDGARRASILVGIPCRH